MGKDDITKEPTQPIALYSKEFLDRIRQFKTDMHKFYTDIGAEKTPKYDGAGREIIKKRPDGYDYIVEGYMRKKLDQYFPGWSWEQGIIQFLGEWIVTSAHLVIIDEHLLAFNIQPPVRRFFGSGADRIQFKRDKPHTPEYVVDIDKNVATSNTKALKRSINRLTNIGDDVYGKRIDEEGAGSLEEVIMATDEPSKAKDMFLMYIKPMLVSKVLAILEIKSLSDITDYQLAFQTLKEKLG